MLTRTQRLKQTAAVLFLAAMLALFVGCASASANEDTVAEPEGEGIAFAASAPVQNGWYTNDAGRRFYYRDGRLVEGESFVDGYWRYFDPEQGCAMAVGRDVWLGSSGGKWVRYNEGGEMIKGEDCRMSKDDGRYHWWYFDPTTGAMLKGWQYVQGQNKWVYYDATMGWMLYGEQCVPCGNNPGDAYHWYYFDDVTGATTYGWKYLSANGGKWVCYDDTMGWMLHGSQWVDGSVYYFDPTTGAAHFKDPSITSNKQRRAIESAYTTASLGYGLCAGWVTAVFNKVGIYFDSSANNGDADDLFWAYCKYTSRDQLKPGMIIAVPSHTKTELGKKWGHICIYVGAGTVLDSHEGSIRTSTLDWWLSFYTTNYTPQWGWYGNVRLA